MMRRFRTLAAVLAVTALMAVLAWSLHRPFGYLAAEHWRTQLDQAPAAQAEALAARLAQLGKPGIRALVEALGSDREVTASAACRALRVELERWESLAAPSVTRNLAVLAEALSHNAERFGPAARRDAADLATEVLRWLPDVDNAARLEVIAHCDRVFDHAAADRHAVLSLDHALQAQEPSDGSVSSPAPPRLEMPEMPAVVSAQPGAGLPIETFPTYQPEQPRAESTADRRSERFELERAPDAQGAPVPRLSSPGELFLPEGVRPLSATESFPAAPRPMTMPASIADSTASILSEAEPDATLEAEETDVLMRWLQSDDASVANRAEAVLRGRGFTAVHIELARQLFDPDPAVRIELARTVPRLTSIDPVPWLLWLSRDPRTEVRLAAISLMATTSDPALHARIRQMARDDADAAVQRVARRLDER